MRRASVPRCVQCPSRCDGSQESCGGARVRTEPVGRDDRNGRGAGSTPMSARCPTVRSTPRAHVIAVVRTRHRAQSGVWSSGQDAAVSASTCTTGGDCTRATTSASRIAAAGVAAAWKAANTSARRRDANGRLIGRPARRRRPSRYRRARRSSCALIATITVLSDIRMAATAGDRRIPYRISTPAASGMANTLYPAAHHRFCSIFR